MSTQAERGSGSRAGVTILAFFDRVSLFHTLAPYLRGVHSRIWGGPPPKLTYTDDPDWCLHKDKNDCLIMERMFLKPPVTDLALLDGLRRRYRRVFFFNGNAGAAIQRPEVLPFVDRFYNKALFSAKSLYTRALYGRELFTDYYHREFGVIDDPEIEPSPAPEEALSKVRVGWNIGVGDFPRRHFRQRVGVALSRAISPRLAAPIVHLKEMLDPTPPTFEWARSASVIDVNARLGNPGHPTIAFHRKHLMGILEAAANRRGWSVAKDRVSIRRYSADLRRSAITFSPFGWGELCFRDFEAIRAGSVMVKPDMGHLATWPDVYIPQETYVPVAWDGSDLEERIAFYLANPERCRRMAENAFELYRSRLAQLPERAAAVLRELIDG